MRLEVFILTLEMFQLLISLSMTSKKKVLSDAGRKGVEEYLNRNKAIHEKVSLIYDIGSSPSNTTASSPNPLSPTPPPGESVSPSNTTS